MVVVMSPSSGEPWLRERGDCDHCNYENIPHWFLLRPVRIDSNHSGGIPVVKQSGKRADLRGFPRRFNP
jgi:hypothetical protein